VASHAEEQELEDLKKWWSENGRSIIAGVVLGIAVIGGWRGWEGWQQSRAEAASDLHQQAMQAFGAGQRERLAELAGQLALDYADTPYAALSGLALASAQVGEGDLAAAATTLQRVAGDGSGEAAQVARLRLARVQIEQGEADAALQTLADDFPPAFVGLVAEVRGDAHLAAGDVDAARAAYSEARDSGSALADAAALEIKLNELAGAAD